MSKCPVCGSEKSASIGVGMHGFFYNYTIGKIDNLKICMGCGVVYAPYKIRKDIMKAVKEKQK